MSVISSSPSIASIYQPLPYPTHNKQQQQQQPPHSASPLRPATIVSSSSTYPNNNRSPGSAASAPLNKLPPSQIVAAAPPPPPPAISKLSLPTNVPQTRVPYPPYLPGIFWPQHLPARWGTHKVSAVELLPLGTPSAAPTQPSSPASSPVKSGSSKMPPAPVECNCVASDAQCSRFAVSSDDTLIRLYSTDKNSGAIVLEAFLSGHTGFCYALCWVPSTATSAATASGTTTSGSEQFLLSGSGSSERPTVLRLWNVNSRQQATEALKLGEMGWIWRIAHIASPSTATHNLASSVFATKQRSTSIATSSKSSFSCSVSELARYCVFVVPFFLRGVTLGWLDIAFS